ncbi:MAG: GntR family transcriptional regulator [Lentisphaeria bacterium]|nr:GntR family transcriptional regulator [Lentisphaeria bacterium]
MNTKTPIFKEVAGNLSVQIKERGYAPGTALPSENELCRQYSISRFSVRKALSILEAEGLIVRQPGVGSIVCESSGKKPAPKQLNIGISGTNPDNPYAGVIYEGAGQACNRCSARLVFTSCDDFIAAGGDGFDGFILLPMRESYSSWEQLNQIAASGKPVVFMNRITDLPHIAYAAVDYELESRRAVDFLFRLGRQRVGLLTCDDVNQYANRTRARGYSDACKKAGKPELVCRLPNLVLESIDQAERFIAEQQPDALFVTTHAITEYALIARRNCNRPDLTLFCFIDRIPRQKQYDNVMFVEMPLQRMAEQAVRHISDKCRLREPHPVMRQLFGTDFVLSSSIQ